jgi:2-polyprenyl-3-methyl-5-hydroxy-6-metoxy-1,4-benzoquinol methylase
MEDLMEITLNEAIKLLRSKFTNRQLASYLYQIYDFNLRFILLDVGCGTGILPEISQPI